MNTRGWWLNLMGGAVTAWQESGENPLLFCYLMGWDAYSQARAVALAPIPVTVRNNSECLTSSSTSFTHYSTPRV
jgi:hypothetical protein